MSNRNLWGLPYELTSLVWLVMPHYVRGVTCIERAAYVNHHEVSVAQAVTTNREYGWY